jgi:hypothetical protein
MATAEREQQGRGAVRSYPWENLDDEALLRLRFRDLRLAIAGSPVAEDLAHLYGELERRGIPFKPHAWLSTEWFSPDGIPGIAVPFFVVHPRLRRLEQRMTGNVEGGARKWRRRILRHEAGHALDTAYGLRRRADWRATFGPASRRYPSDYTVSPGSRRHVLHLGHWYAQSHPTEDFAETFAVWLQPKARWQREYVGWPALGKLQFVDAVAEEIAGQLPRKVDRSVVAPLAQNSRTLLEHYHRRKAGGGYAERRYDGWLKETFAVRAARPEAASAAPFIRERSASLRRALMRRTGAGAYLVDHAVATITARVRQLDLVLHGSKRDNERRVVRLHERVILDVLRRNRERYTL